MRAAEGDTRRRGRRRDARLARRQAAFDAAERQGDGDVRPFRRPPREGAGVAQGEQPPAGGRVRRPGGVQGALRFRRSRRGLQLHAVAGARRNRAVRAQGRQALADRGSGRDDGRRLLGAGRDGREDEAPLHAARELLLRRGGAAGDFALPPQRSRNIDPRRMRLHPRPPAGDIQRRISGPLAHEVEHRPRRQPVSNPRARAGLPVPRRQPRRPDGLSRLDGLARRRLRGSAT